MFKNDIASVLVSEVSEALNHRSEIPPLFFGAPGVPENAYFRYASGLRTRQARPGNDGSAGKGNEVPPSHWITSSARARSVGGIVRPSAFAVLRLRTRSNRVGC